MEGSAIEYIIKPQKGGKRLIYKVLTVVGIIAVCATVILVLLNLLPFQLFMPAALIILSVSAAIGFILLKILSVEYEISLSRTEFSVVSIHGKRWRRPILDLPISEITEIGIYDDDSYERLCKKPIHKSVTCISSFDAPNILYALFELDGETGLICFEADEQVTARLKSLNPRAFRQGSIQ